MQRGALDGALKRQRVTVANIEAKLGTDPAVADTDADGLLLFGSHRVVGLNCQGQ